MTPKRAAAAAAARFKPYGHVQKGGQTDGRTCLGISAGKSVHIGSKPNTNI